MKSWKAQKVGTKLIYKAGVRAHFNHILPTKGERSGICKNQTEFCNLPFLGMYLNETVPHCKTNHSTFCTMTTFGKEVVQLQMARRNCPLPCKTKSYKATIVNYLSFSPNMQSSGTGIWFFIDKPYVKVEVSTV